MLQNADPTGEIQPDSQDMLDLEEECYMMGPLIDKKLQDIDEQHAELEDLNLKILEAFQFYNNLMKESISKQTALISNSQMAPAPLGSMSMMSSSAAGMGGLVGVSSTNGVPAGPNPTGGAISYAAAPPSLEANSLNFAHKLNSMAAYAQMSQSPQQQQSNNGFGANSSATGTVVGMNNPGITGGYASMPAHNLAGMNNMNSNILPSGLNMYPGGGAGQYMGPMNGVGAGLMHNNPSQTSLNGSSNSMMMMMGPGSMPTDLASAGGVGGLSNSNSQPQMASANFN